MRYEQVYDGEWFPVPAIVACCQCNLVHSIRVRRRKGRYEVSFKRDNRRTGQLRRK